MDLSLLTANQEEAELSCSLRNLNKKKPLACWQDFRVCHEEKKTLKGKTWRHHWDKRHWWLTWLVKEKEQGTWQCILRNILRMVVLYFPLFFLFLPFWHREGFSTQQYKLQQLQTEIFWEESWEYAKPHGSRRTLCREYHMKWLSPEIWEETERRRKSCQHERKVHNMDRQPVCWRALLQVWPSQLSEDWLCLSEVSRSYLEFCSITFTEKICLSASFPVISTILMFQHFLLWGQFLLLIDEKTNWISDNGITMCTGGLHSVML